MIFFGSRSKVVPGETVSGLPCPNCGHQQFSSFGIQKYFHLYWIPTFPTGRSVGLECANCRHTMVDGELPQGMGDDIRSRAFANANGLTSFTGTLIIAALVAFGYYAVKHDEAELASLIAAPAVNDYYVADFTKVFVDADDEYPYGAMKIVELSESEVGFRISNVVFNRTSGVESDIKDGSAAVDAYFGGDVVYMDLSELPRMQEDGAIRSVERL